VVVYHLAAADVELLDQRYGASNLDVQNSDVPALDDLNPPITRRRPESGQVSQSRSSGPGAVPPESRSGEVAGLSSSGGSSATGPSA
jgi:hypothetical protein